MDNQAGSGKSKLYCNRCGSFDLTKLNRTFTAKYIFNEPRKLHCQSCNAKLSFQQIALNRALKLPSFYAESNDTVLSNNQRGDPVYVTMDEYVSSVAKPVAQWLPFWTGVVSGLALFAILISLLFLSPYSKARNVVMKQAVYEQPIVRLGDVELLRLDNSTNKNADIEVVLLEEPKKAPADLIWEDVAGSVERLVTLQPQAIPAVRLPVDTIQQDLDRLLAD